MHMNIILHPDSKNVDELPLKTSANLLTIFFIQLKKENSWKAAQVIEGVMDAMVS